MTTRRYTANYAQYFTCSALLIPNDLKSRMVLTAELLATLNGLLNKLAPENYETTVIRICDIFKSITEVDTLTTATQTLLRKASGEAKYVQLYAQLVLALSSCTLIESTMSNLIFDAMNAELSSTDKRILCGTARFAGELYVAGIMATTRLVYIITTLLDRKTEDGVEVVTHLLSVAGPRFELNDGPLFQTTLDGVQTCSVDVGVSRRVRFGLLNLIELRDNRWVPRRKADEVKVEAKYSPVHLDNFASPTITASSSTDDGLVNLASPSSDGGLSEEEVEREVTEILEEYCDLLEPSEVAISYQQLKGRGVSPETLVCYTFRVYAEGAVAKHPHYEKLWPQLIDHVFTSDELRLALENVMSQMSELKSDFPHMPKATRSFVAAWRSRSPELAEPYASI